MKEFLRRTVTAILFVALMLGVVWGGMWPVIVLAIVVNALGLFEFCRIMERQYNVSVIWESLIAGTLMVLLLPLHMSGLFTLLPWMFLAALLFPAYWVVALYRKQRDVFLRTGIALAAMVYVSFGMAAFAMLGVHPGGGPVVLTGLLIILWLLDTGAYLTGRFFGRKKLFPSVSPGKSVEGLAGGIVVAFAAAYGYSSYMELPLFFWLVMGGLVVVSGTFGDLAESRLKRDAELKDSGTLLPGHGGVLDRFDALLFAAPAGWVWTYWALVTGLI